MDIDHWALFRYRGAMNQDLTPIGGSWPPAPDVPSPHLGRGQRSYSAEHIFDLATLLRIVRESPWLIVAGAGLGLALALLATLLTTPVYRAAVTLEANPPKVSVSTSQSRDDEASNENSYDFVATQVGLVSSRAVAERTAQVLGLADKPEIVPQNLEATVRQRMATDTVAAGLKVKNPQSGTLIKFTFDSTSPQLAAQVANTVADSFINTALQRRYEASAYARNFLERQINKTRSDLERSERSLVAYAQAQGIISTAGVGADGKSTGGETNSLQGDTMVKLNGALADATAKRIAAEGAYREALSAGPTVEVSNATVALRQQVAALESEYQQKRTYMKPDHPDMVSLRSQITEMQRQIASASSQTRSSMANTLLAQYRAALSSERALQARVTQLKGDVLNLRGRSIEYTILQREVDTNRSLYDALLQRYKEIGVAGGVGMAPVSIVDRAVQPNAPFKPNLFLNLLIGGVVGLLTGLAGAIGVEVFNDTIKTRDDVRNKLLIPCLGIIPMAGAKASLLEDLGNPASIVSEAYSTVAAALRFSTESGMPRVLLLTSTRSGEGKSSSAVGMAQNFARRGQSVLLIDADMRKPAFKVTRSVGLSKLLTAEDSLADHVITTKYPNFSLLPSGPIPPNPADLLSTGRIRKIIAEAVTRYDLVIVDGPPILGLADSPLLAAAIENILFVVESGKTRTRAAVEALNRIDATGAHILGAALTKATDLGSSYGYGSSSYGYGYGKQSRRGSFKSNENEILLIGSDTPLEETDS